MTTKTQVFHEDEVLHKLAHYLPSQAPLKDFVHHNTLHAFQDMSFHEALSNATTIFGYTTYLSLPEYRELYKQGKIQEEILNAVLEREKPLSEREGWKTRLLNELPTGVKSERIGQFRECWKSRHSINLDKIVHPTLFQWAGSFLDQGVSIWSMPGQEGLIESIRLIENNSYRSYFRSKRTVELLNDPATTISQLLNLIVGSEKMFERYLFDMSFAHPGWSGMMAVLDENVSGLLDKRTVIFSDFIRLELLLELDTLWDKLGEGFTPIGSTCQDVDPDLFAPVVITPEFELCALWQEAYEWSYFDAVLLGLASKGAKKTVSPAMQAIFCIDDRESSLRTYLEREAHGVETFGTAGFFNVVCNFQPENSRFTTKVCPAPITPKHIIREEEATSRNRKESHFSKNTQGFFTGWLISQTLGFWSALKMVGSIFFPTKTASVVSSFDHMDLNAKLTIDFEGDVQDGCAVGFTEEEMLDATTGLLRAMGLVDNFAPLVYVVGHGASSVNNTYYAGYDCGACCGRAGSVNARVAANILNRDSIREGLKQRGITIPASTKFLGGLHDTTRDEVAFFDTDVLDATQRKMHEANLVVFNKSLQKNAKERSRRFLLVNTKMDEKRLHQKVKRRSVSLFEPRPEWNHATNALCIVGKRSISENVFLDRRAFLQSYDAGIDPNGDLLKNILGAVTPVCGGINLEYYFSRVDNQRLGAGSKLPHNVMGLIGVVNGMEGDLRTGLPAQMVNIHDPLRLLMVVEHHPEVVLSVLNANPAIKDWYSKKWLLLAVIDPVSQELFVFNGASFEAFQPVTKELPIVGNLSDLVTSTDRNISVHLMTA